MTHGPDPEDTRPVPAANGEPGLSREVPFSLTWLHALDPRIFTPLTWQLGGMTRIQLASPGGTTNVSIYRTVSHYADGGIGLQDEVYDYHGTPGSQFNYEFGAAPGHPLTRFNQAAAATARMQEIVRDLSQLAAVAGSTITARNRDHGDDCGFVSDGRRWISARTGQPITTLPGPAAGRPRPGPPAAVPRPHTGPEASGP